MRNKIIIVSILVLASCHLGLAQQKVDTTLKKQLDELMIKDQQYRKFMNYRDAQKDSLARQFGVPVDSLSNHLWTLQNNLDSTNWAEIEAIFQKQGYPGKTLVGEPSDEVAWYILQHNLMKIQQYFPLVEQAGKKGELPYSLVAKMQDRLLMMNNEKQIYGTQATGLQILNPETGKKEFQWIVWPIKDPENVNKRRKEAGFDDTVEENAKRLGAKYTGISLEEVNKIRADNR
jgi:hypothetical protein